MIFAFVALPEMACSSELGGLLKSETNSSLIPLELRAILKVVVSHHHYMPLLCHEDAPVNLYIARRGTKRRTVMRELTSIELKCCLRWKIPVAHLGENR